MFGEENHLVPDEDYNELWGEEVIPIKKSGVVESVKNTVGTIKEKAHKLIRKGIDWYGNLPEFDEKTGHHITQYNPWGQNLSAKSINQSAGLTELVEHVRDFLTSDEDKDEHKEVKTPKIKKQKGQNIPSVFNKDIEKSILINPESLITKKQESENLTYNEPYQLNTSKNLILQYTQENPIVKYSTTTSDEIKHKNISIYKAKEIVREHEDKTYAQKQENTYSVIKSMLGNSNINLSKGGKIKLGQFNIDLTDSKFNDQHQYNQMMMTMYQQEEGPNGNIRKFGAIVNWIAVRDPKTGDIIYQPVRDPHVKNVHAWQEVLLPQADVGHGVLGFLSKIGRKIFSDNKLARDGAAALSTLFGYPLEQILGNVMGQGFGGDNYATRARYHDMGVINYRNFYTQLRDNLGGEGLTARKAGNWILDQVETVIGMSLSQGLGGAAGLGTYIGIQAAGKQFDSLDREIKHYSKHPPMTKDMLPTEEADAITKFEAIQKNGNSEFEQNFRAKYEGLYQQESQKLDDLIKHHHFKNKAELDKYVADMQNRLKAMQEQDIAANKEEVSNTLRSAQAINDKYGGLLSKEEYEKAVNLLANRHNISMDAFVNGVLSGVIMGKLGGVTASTIQLLGTGLLTKFGARETAKYFTRALTDFTAKNVTIDMIREIAYGAVDMSAINVITSTATQYVDNVLLKKDFSWKEVGGEALSGLVVGALFGGTHAAWNNFKIFTKDSKFFGGGRFSELQNWVEAMTPTVDMTMLPEDIIRNEMDIKIPKGEGSEMNQMPQIRSQETYNKVKEILKDNPKLVDRPDIIDKVASFVMQVTAHSEEARKELGPILERLKETGKNNLESFSEENVTRARNLKAITDYTLRTEFDKIKNRTPGEKVETIDGKSHTVYAEEHTTLEDLYKKIYDKIQKHGPLSKADHEAISLSLTEFAEVQAKSFLDGIDNILHPNNIHNLAERINHEIKHIDDADNAVSDEWRKSFAGDGEDDYKAPPVEDPEILDRTDEAIFSTAEVQESDDPAVIDKVVEEATEMAKQAMDHVVDTEKETALTPEYKGISDTALIEVLKDSVEEITRDPSESDFIARHDAVAERLNNKIRSAEEVNPDAFQPSEEGEIDIEPVVATYHRNAEDVHCTMVFDGNTYTVNVNGDTGEAETFGDAVKLLHESLLKLYSERETSLELSAKLKGDVTQLKVEDEKKKEEIEVKKAEPEKGITVLQEVLDNSLATIPMLDDRGTRRSLELEKKEQLVSDGTKFEVRSNIYPHRSPAEYALINDINKTNENFNKPKELPLGGPFGIGLSNNWTELEARGIYQDGSIPGLIREGIRVSQLETRKERQTIMNEWKKVNKEEYNKMLSYFPMKYYLGKFSFPIADELSKAGVSYMRQKNKLVEKYILDGGKPITNIVAERKFPEKMNTGPSRSDFRRGETNIIKSSTAIIGRSGNELTKAQKNWGGLLLKNDDSGVYYFMEGVPMGQLNMSDQITDILWTALQKGAGGTIGDADNTPEISMGGETMYSNDLLDMLFKSSPLITSSSRVKYEQRGTLNTTGKYIYYDIDGQRLVYVDKAGKENVVVFNRGYDTSRHYVAVKEILKDVNISIDPKKFNDNDTKFRHNITIGDFKIKKGDTYKDMLLNNHALSTIVKDMEHPFDGSTLTIKSVSGTETNAEKMNTILDDTAKGKIEVNKTLASNITYGLDTKVEVSEEEAKKDYSKDILAIIKSSNLSGDKRAEAIKEYFPAIPNMTDYDGIVKSIANRVLDELGGQVKLDDKGISVVRQAFEGLTKTEIGALKEKLSTDLQPEKKAWVEKGIAIRKELIGSDDAINRVISDVVYHIKTKGGLGGVFESYMADDLNQQTSNFESGSSTIDPYTRCSDRLMGAIDHIVSGVSEYTTFDEFYSADFVRSALMLQLGDKFTTMDEMIDLLENLSKDNALVNSFYQKIAGDKDLLGSAYTLFHKRLVNYVNSKYLRGEHVLQPVENKGKTQLKKWNDSIEGTNVHLSTKEDFKNAYRFIKDHGLSTWVTPTSESDGTKYIHDAVIVKGHTFEDYTNNLKTCMNALGIDIDTNILQNAATVMVINDERLRTIAGGGPAAKDLAMVLALDGMLRGDLGPTIEIQTTGKIVDPHRSIFRDISAAAQTPHDLVDIKKFPSINRLSEIIRKGGGTPERVCVYSQKVPYYLYQPHNFLSVLSGELFNDAGFVSDMVSNERCAGNMTLANISQAIAEGVPSGIRLLETLEMKAKGERIPTRYSKATDRMVTMTRLYAAMKDVAAFRQVGEKGRLYFFEGISGAPIEGTNEDIATHLVKFHGAAEIKTIDTAHRVRAHFLHSLHLHENKGIQLKDQKNLEDRYANRLAGKAEADYFNGLSAETQRNIMRDAKCRLDSFGMIDGYHYEYVPEKDKDGRVVDWKIKLDGAGYKPRFFDFIGKEIEDLIGHSINLDETQEAVVGKIGSLCSDQKIITKAYDHLNNKIRSELENLEKVGLIELDPKGKSPDGLTDFTLKKDDTVYKNTILSIPDDLPLVEGENGRYPEEDYARRRIVEEAAAKGISAMPSPEKIASIIGIRRGILNSIYHDLELNELVEGDPAFAGSYTKQTKRITSVNSPGEFFSLREGEPNEFQVLRVHDWIASRPESWNNWAERRAEVLTKYAMALASDDPSSPWHKYYGKTQEQVKEMCLEQARTETEGMMKLNGADGQAYITPDFARRMMIARGKWSISQENAFNAMRAGAPIAEWGHELLTPVMKCVYVDFRPVPQLMPDGNTINMMVSEFDKSSYAPIGFSKEDPLYELAKWMENNGVSVLTTASATKMGGGEKLMIFDSDGNVDINAVRAHGSEYLTTHRMDRFRHQLETDPHGERAEQMGRQPFNIAFPNSFLHPQLHWAMNDAINKYTSLLKTKFNEVIRERKGDPTHTVVSFGVKARDRGDNTMDALAQGIPMEMLSNPKMLDYLASGISSIIENRVNTTHGYQVSAVGDKDLKAIDEHGMAEIKINRGALNNLFPAGVDHTTAVALFNKAKEDLGGKLPVISCRIPTQGKTSMLVCNIKEMLPDSAGDVVYMAPENQARLGSDYDGDSLYSYRPHYVWTMEVPKNWYVNNHLMKRWVQKTYDIQEPDSVSDRGSGLLKNRVDFDKLKESHIFAMNNGSIFDEKSGLFYTPKKGYNWANEVRCMELGHYSGSDMKHSTTRDRSPAYYANQFLNAAIKSLMTEDSMLQSTQTVDGPVSHLKGIYDEILPDMEKEGLMKIGVQAQVENKRTNLGGQDIIAPYAKVMKSIDLIGDIFKSYDMEGGGSLAGPHGTTHLQYEYQDKSKKKAVKLSFTVQTPLANHQRVTENNPGIFNLQGRPISDDIVAALSMAVDAGKDSSIIMANNNPNTAYACAFMLLEGHGDAAHLLIANPIIRDYAELRNNGSKKDTAVREVIGRYLGEEGMKMEDVIKELTKHAAEIQDYCSKSLNPEWLKEQVLAYKRSVENETRLTSDYKLAQIGIMFTFQQAEKAATDFFDFTRPLGELDGPGMGRSFVDFYDRIAQLEKAGILAFDPSEVNSTQPYSPQESLDPFNFTKAQILRLPKESYYRHKLETVIDVAKKIQDNGPLEFSQLYLKTVHEILNNHLSYINKNENINLVTRICSAVAWTVDKDSSDVYIQGLFDRFSGLERKGAIDPSNEITRQFRANTTAPERGLSEPLLKLDLRDIEDREITDQITDSFRSLQQYAYDHGFVHEFNDWARDYVVYSFLSIGNGTASHLLPPEWIKDAHDSGLLNKQAFTNMEESDIKYYKAGILSNMVGMGLPVEVTPFTKNQTDYYVGDRRVMASLRVDPAATTVPDAVVLEGEGPDIYILSDGEETAVYVSAGENNLYLKNNRYGWKKGFDLTIQSVDRDYLDDLSSLALKELYLPKTETMDNDEIEQRLSDIKIPEITDNSVDEVPVEENKLEPQKERLSISEDPDTAPVANNTVGLKAKDLTKTVGDINFNVRPTHHYVNGRDIVIGEMQEEELDSKISTFVLNDDMMDKLVDTHIALGMTPNIKNVGNAIFKNITDAERIYLPPDGVKMKEPLARALKNFMAKDAVHVEWNNGRAYFSPLASFAGGKKASGISPMMLEESCDRFKQLYPDGIRGGMSYLKARDASTNPYIRIATKNGIKDMANNKSVVALAGLLYAGDGKIPPAVIIDQMGGTPQKLISQLKNVMDSKMLRDIVGEYYRDPQYDEFGDGISQEEIKRRWDDATDKGKEATICKIINC